MIKSDFKSVTFTGGLPTLCVELENIIKHFKQTLVENGEFSEEKANELIAEIGRRAFMDDEERQKVLDEAMEEFGGMLDLEDLFKEE